MYSKVASRSTTVKRARAMEEIWTQNKRSVKYPNPRSNKQTINNHKYFELHKGQLISKTNCQAEDSSKKRTNEFILTSMRRVLVRFLEESLPRKKCYEII